MSDLKITSWNVENLDRLLGEDLTANLQKRRDAVVTEIRDLAPDILCLIEGPKGEAAIDTVADELLGGEYVPVKAGDGEYDIRGDQWMWFLVRPSLKEKVELLPPATWDALTGGKWDVHYWGIDKKARHDHYRHPQVLIL
ncbi:MAG TPA: endonuclease/exonuclease/phosphatase family protein, partial [Phycisphaerae bacterium]|nr:endonuclease/exonuclease/phosphatase family protein [Phycisphaerae bacterium]